MAEQKDFGKKYPVSDKGILDVLGKQEQIFRQHVSFDEKGVAILSEKHPSFLTLSQKGKPMLSKTVKTERGNDMKLESYWISPTVSDREMMVTRLLYTSPDGTLRASKNKILTYNCHKKDGVVERKSLFQKAATSFQRNGQQQTEQKSDGPTDAAQSE